MHGGNPLPARPSTLIAVISRRQHGTIAFSVSTSIGLNTPVVDNIQPDEDNVVRWYTNYESLAGYRIPGSARRFCA